MKTTLENSIIKFIKYSNTKHKTVTMVTIGLIICSLTPLAIIFFLPEQIRGNGIVLPAEYKAVFALSSGRILSIHVPDGTRVKQGELLFELDTHKEKLLMTESSMRIKQHTSTLKKLAEAEIHENARYALELKHLKDLLSLREKAYNAGTESKQAIEELHYRLQALTNDREIQRIKTENTMHSLRSDIEQLQLSYTELERIYNNRKVTAPSDGIFSMKTLLNDNEKKRYELVADYQKDRYVNEGELLGFILTTDGYHVRLTVPEKAASDIRTGTRLTIHFHAMNGISGTTAKATITSIAPLAVSGGVLIHASLTEKVPDTIDKLTGTAVTGIIPVTYTSIAGYLAGRM